MWFQFFVWTIVGGFGLLGFCAVFRLACGTERNIYGIMDDIIDTLYSL